VQNEVQRLSSEISRTQNLVQNELRPMCSAESRLQAAEVRVTNIETPIRVNLFGIVSNPAESCLPADIRISATFHDDSGTFICGGSVVVPQTSFVQNTAVEFRPYELEVFLKWWDGPTLKQQTLVCRDYQGNDMRNPAEHATRLKVFATIAPKRGGLATSEMQLILPRLQTR
jgi:hypothetical protein